MGKKKNKLALVSELVEEKSGGKKYSKELARLHVELAHLQAWVKKSGARIAIVFEAATPPGRRVSAPD